MLARIAQDRQRRRAVGLHAGTQHDERLRHVQPLRVRAGNDGRFGHIGVLDQHRLQLERAQPVVGTFENVIGASHVGDVAIAIPRGNVARVVVAIAHRIRTFFRVADVALHQAHRAPRQVDADLALLRRLAIDVEKDHRIARHRLSHAADLDRLARGIADHAGCFRLAETVPDRQAPGVFHPVNHFGVQRLASPQHFTQLHVPARKVFLDQHAPDGGWRTQARHAMLDQHIQQVCRLESCVVVDKDACAGIPRREEAAPRMLAPAGRGDVQVHIPCTQAGPVHRGQVADRVALVGVQHQLRLGGGAGGEVQQQRIGGPGRRVRAEIPGRAARVLEGVPASSLTDNDAGEAATDLVQPGNGFRIADDVSDVAALDTVLQVRLVQQGGGRDQDSPDLHQGQHRLPQFFLVAQHQQHAITTLHPQLDKPVGDLVRA